MKLVEPPAVLKCPPVDDIAFWLKELKAQVINTTIGRIDFLIKLVTNIEFHFKNLPQCIFKHSINIILILIQTIYLLTVTFSLLTVSQPSQIL